LGWVVRDVSSHYFDSQFPSSAIQSRGCDRRIRFRSSHARDRSSHVERRRLEFVSSLKISRHAPSRPSSARCSATRSGLLRGLAGRRFFQASFHISPGGAPGSLSGPSQVCSRPMGEPSPFLALGPTCRFARRASASINFRRGDSIAETIESGRAVAFDFWALTPICDPNPSALKPGDRSCLGLCLLQGLPDACLRTQTGSTPY
jgi:hypothetical protein